MRLSEFIDQSNRLASPAAVVALMERAAKDQGFNHYAYCALTRHERYDAGDNPAPAVVHNFPADWINFYFGQNYQTIDPVVLFAPQLDRPFFWNGLDQKFPLDRMQKTILQQAGEAKLHDGIGVPLHDAQGNVCLMTFAADDSHPDPTAELSTLNALAAQFHLVYKTIGLTDIDSTTVPLLSKRERECLQWIARGKSTWEVGMILHISENTTKYHIKNATSKLNSHTRTQAVLAAVQCGQLTLESVLFTT